MPGAIIFLLFGTAFLFFIPKCFKNKNTDTDCKACPVTTATLIGTENFGGDRWITEFSVDGKEALGMDDSFAVEVFGKSKYPHLKRGDREEIYYRKYTGKQAYSINGKKVEYIIHFCDESRYALLRKKEKNKILCCRILGAVLILCALLILIFG